MKHSFEGIGQWAATFTCDGEVSANHVVKISGNETVSPCVAGDAFCGVTVFVGRDGEACSVALGGMVTTTYTGGVPALGWGGLSADGQVSCLSSPPLLCSCQCPPLIFALCVCVLLCRLHIYLQELYPLELIP